MTGPLYDIVMVADVLAAVVGFGALGSTGAYAAAVRHAPDPYSSATVVRYFRPGSNWAARSILLVPLLGGALLALNHGQDVGAAWPWIGLAIWTVATGVASMAIWPAEREVQRHLVSGAPGPEERSALRGAAVRIERAAAMTSLLSVAVLVVMIWQPV